MRERAPWWKGETWLKGVEHEHEYEYEYEHEPEEETELSLSLSKGSGGGHRLRLLPTNPRSSTGWICLLLHLPSHPCEGAAR